MDPDANDHPKEACGLYGVYGSPDVVPLIYRGLFAQQHRGQEGGGIVVSDGERVQSVKGTGLITDVFAKREARELSGTLGIGHVRYSTSGSTRPQNLQPLVARMIDGIWAVAHNGNLVNAEKLRRSYEESGAIFQTGTDSEVLIHLLADPRFRQGSPRVAGALAELSGAYSLLLMTKDCVMAARDPWGFRPLSIGRIGDAYVFASETCAFSVTGATHERDLEPGELVIVDKNGLRSHTIPGPPVARKAHCVFEQVYFARPDSTVFGRNVHLVRVELGERLAEEHAVEADIVCPMPDSGNSAALGYSQKSGIPLNFGFIRNHYVGRTFIMPVQDERSASADMKLSIMPEVVRGRRVVVVDDSLVRGTTMKRRVIDLRGAGAKEVHVRISCPPIAHPCFYGIDFPTREELLAARGDVSAICDFIEADSLGYLSEDGLLAPFENRGDYCTACFTGDYRVDPSGATGKLSMETDRLLFNLSAEA
tara:strand:- start:235 stop:1674 length:1440 start_codon:yes stop_codon:yes gene_type:complete